MYNFLKTDSTLNLPGLSLIALLENLSLHKVPQMPSVEEQSLSLLQISSPSLARQMVISGELLDGVYVLFADHSSLRGREGRDNQKSFTWQPCLFIVSMALLTASLAGSHCST